MCVDTHTHTHQNLQVQLLGHLVDINLNIITHIILLVLEEKRDCKMEERFARWRKRKELEKEWKKRWFFKAKCGGIPATCHVPLQNKWVLHPLSTKVPTNLTPYLNFKY